MECFNQILLQTQPTLWSSIGCHSCDTYHQSSGNIHQVWRTTASWRILDAAFEPEQQESRHRRPALVFLASVAEGSLPPELLDAVDAPRVEQSSRRHAGSILNTARLHLDDSGGEEEEDAREQEVQKREEELLTSS